jgi:hypothetical protein
MIKMKRTKLDENYLCKQSWLGPIMKEIQSLNPNLEPEQSNKPYKSMAMYIFKLIT